MADPNLTFTAALAVFLGLAMISLAGLKAWHGWLELKRTELESRKNNTISLPSPGTRIELADLKERVRKLEAIANGADS